MAPQECPLSEVRDPFQQLTNLGKSWAPANLFIRVPLFDLTFVGRTRRLRLTNFKSAAAGEVTFLRIVISLDLLV
jgi:hypothetical protein